MKELDLKAGIAVSNPGELSIAGYCCCIKGIKVEFTVFELCCRVARKHILKNRCPITGISKDEYSALRKHGRTGRPLGS